MRKTLKAMIGALVVLTLTAPPTSAEKAYEVECGGNGCGDITDFTWSGYQWHGGSMPAGSNAYTVHANREHAETGYARYFTPLGYHGLAEHDWGPELWTQLRTSGPENAKRLGTQSRF